MTEEQIDRFKTGGQNAAVPKERVLHILPVSGQLSSTTFFTSSTNHLIGCFDGTKRDCRVMLMADYTHKYSLFETGHNFFSFIKSLVNTNCTHFDPHFARKLESFLVVQVRNNAQFIMQRVNILGQSEDIFHWHRSLFRRN